MSLKLIYRLVPSPPRNRRFVAFSRERNVRRIGLLFLRALRWVRENGSIALKTRRGPPPSAPNRSNAEGKSEKRFWLYRCTSSACFSAHEFNSRTNALETRKRRSAYKRYCIIEINLCRNVCSHCFGYSFRFIIHCTCFFFFFSHCARADRCVSFLLHSLVAGTVIEAKCECRTNAI